MSEAILILGESGSGKSTSFRNLNPEETFIINIEDKPLPFRGYKKLYKPLSSDGMEGNYYSPDNHDVIRRVIRLVNEKRPDIKTLIIDDFGYTIMNNFMRRAREKGYDKFSEIGVNAWEVLESLKGLRDDLFCVVTMHVETSKTGFVVPKTVGTMIDQYSNIEGKFTYVFHALAFEGKYKFMTNTDGNRMAKSSMGLYEDRYIDNDLAKIIEDIKEYNEG